MIKKKLDQIPARLKDEGFLENRGSRNNLGVYAFCYEPKDQLAVDCFMDQVTTSEKYPFRVVEIDLFRILVEVMELKRLTERKVDRIEQRYGTSEMLDKLQRTITTDNFKTYFQKIPVVSGRDVVFLTGIGRLFPFFRSHQIMHYAAEVFNSVPVVVMYPGEYVDLNFHLFGRNNGLDEGYYRCTMLLSSD